MGTRLTQRRHLFFDLDDTLWDFERNSSAVLETLFHELQLDAKLGADAATFLQVYKGINQGLWQQYYRGQLDKQAVRDLRFERSLGHFGYNNPDLSRQMSAAYLHLAPQGKLLKEGCLPTLDYLKGNYQLHILTNGFRETQFIKLDGCSLRPYFSQIIIAEDHRVLKPDAKLFRIAEQLAGAIAGQCVMIGDSLDCDVRGALNAGWEAIYTGTEKSEDGVRAVAGLKELMSIF